MTNEIQAVNTGIAGLKNVGLFLQAVTTAQNRAAHLPGLAVFYGPSGYGKSTAAAFAGNKTRAYMVAAKSTWSPKAMLSSILLEMGIEAAATCYQMTDQIAEQLMKSGRPLIIDEADYIVGKKMVEVVRDIYEASSASIILIGEEMLPKN